MANTTEKQNTTTENENAENVQAVAVPENTTENTPENAPANVPENVTIWDTKLADVEAWKIARKNLTAWLDENEADTFGKFFESKASKSSPFSLQNVAIMAHTSAGYVGDKWKKAKELALKNALESKAEYVEARVIESFICDMLAPNLAEERAKAEAERMAKEAERALRLAKIKQAVNDRLGIFDEYGIPKNENTLAKAYKSMTADENKGAIICTLARIILGDKAEAFVKTLGVDTFEVVDVQ